jgi:hypothetical protein
MSQFSNVGLIAYSFQPLLTRKNNQGRLKRRLGHNLLSRFQSLRDEVLRFLSESKCSIYQQSSRTWLADEEMSAENFSWLAFV